MMCKNNLLLIISNKNLCTKQVREQLKVKIKLSIALETFFYTKRSFFPSDRSPRRPPGAEQGYLILAAVAVAVGAKNPTARHLMSIPAPPGIGIAPAAAAAGEVAVERL